MYPGVEYFGWHYYLDNGGVSTITDCTVNAANADWVMGVYALDGPTTAITNCQFTNFGELSSNANFAALYIGHLSGAESMTAASEYASCSGAAELTFSIYDDFDGDGISDYNEVNISHTDPWLADSDGDGIDDDEELQAGTSPYDENDYAFYLSSDYREMFVTTNQVLAQLFFGTNSVSGPISVTNCNMHFDWGYCSTSTGEKPMLKVWHDANWNDLFDEDETSVTCKLAIKGFNVVQTNYFVYGAFDSDNDGIPDLWEDQVGLSRDNRNDALIDNDGDGLINLHEFWAGGDPFSIGDETNSALYAFCHSIDDRIVNTNKDMNLFVNYIANGEQTNFVKNANCWAYDIDLSCASMWNSKNKYQRAGTAISPRHVIFAKHFSIPVGDVLWFMACDGEILSRTVVETINPIGDIAIGLLDSELPTNQITIATIVDDNFEDYLGCCKYLPIVRLDQEEKAIVSNLATLRSSSLIVAEILPHKQNEVLYFEGVVSGDSGDPQFLVYGDCPVILGALTSYVANHAGSGPFYTFHRDKIQQAMDELCRGYLLKTFNLENLNKLKYGNSHHE